jgi:uncharacterized membrane protein
MFWRAATVLLILAQFFWTSECKAYLRFCNHDGTEKVSIATARYIQNKWYSEGWFVAPPVAVLQLYQEICRADIIGFMHLVPVFHN